MLEQLITTVLPEAAREGFSSEVAALVCRAYQKAPLSKIVISVSPDAVGSIQSQLEPAKADFTIEPDASLSALKAKVNWQGGYDQINLDGALMEIQTIIFQFFNKIEKTGSDNA